MSTNTRVDSTLPRDRSRARLGKLHRATCWSAPLLLLLACEVESGLDRYRRVDEEPDQAPRATGGAQGTGGAVLDPGSGGEVHKLVPSSLSTRDLSSLLPEGVKLVGVTRAADTGALYVLDEELGIFLVEDDAVEHVFDARDLGDFTSVTGPVVEPASPFTDFAALGNDRFALTAKNEGFLLDLRIHRFDLHFCYLPDVGDPGSGDSISVGLTLDGIAHHQLTSALAYHPGQNLLYAQPQSIDDETGEVYGSEIGLFDATTGDPVRWFNLEDPSFLAGGLAAAEGLDVLFLAVGTNLYTFDQWIGLTLRGDLADFGAGEISGLVWDRARLQLVAVERDRPVLHHIELADAP